MASKLAAFDFDNTLVVSTARVRVTKADGSVVNLSPYDYANYEKQDDDSFDYSEFKEVKNAVPLEKYQNMLRSAIADPDTDVAIVTARGKSSIPNIAKYLSSIGITSGVKIKTLQSGKGTAKKNYIRNKIKRDNYTQVDFYDDSEHNVETVADLQSEFPNVKINSELVPESEYEHLIKKSATIADPSKSTHGAKTNHKRQGRLAMNLDRKIRNPKTGNDILIRTALKYPKDSQVYNMARTFIKKILK